MLASKRELADVVNVPLFYRYVEFNCLCSCVSLTWLVSGICGLHLLELLCFPGFVMKCQAHQGLAVGFLLLWYSV